MALRDHVVRAMVAPMLLAGCPGTRGSGPSGDTTGPSAASSAKCGKTEKAFRLNPAVSYTNPDHRSESPVAVGDLDGNGKADIVMGSFAQSSSWGIAVHLNDGNGGLGEPRTYPWHADALAYVIALEDLDGDGSLDVIGMGQGNAGKAGYMLNRGDGTFERAVSLGEVGQGAGSIAGGDFNGDGQRDLVLTDAGYQRGQKPGFAVFLGAGKGRFSGSVHHDTPAPNSEVAVADFNKDGRDDIVAHIGSESLKKGEAYVWLAASDGTFGTPVAYPTPLGQGWADLETGDVDGDGNADIVGRISTSYDTTVYVLRGKGDGSFAAPEDYFIKGDGRFSDMVVADLDGDGRDDVAVHGLHTAYVYLAGSNGRFAEPIRVPTGGKGATGMNTIGAGDLSGSGVQSLVLTYTDTNLAKAATYIAVLSATCT